jgi:S1-C subfamily serine protease
MGHLSVLVRRLRLAAFVLPWLFLGLLIFHIYPSYVATAKLRTTVSELSSQLATVQREQQMPVLVLKQYRNAICYVYAVYTLEWPTKDKVRHIERHTRVSGTGFLVTNNLIATNRHVAQPWYEDDDDQLQIQDGAKPKLEKLLAFFPGMKDPLRLDDVQVSKDHDLAVARLIDTGLPASIQPIPLADSTGDPGQSVVVVGYPLGVSTMLAKSPANLYKRLASSKDTISVANELAAHEMIRPSATCGHLSDIVGEKLIYDAPTAQGGSGGPVFNSRGEVIAINSAYIDGFNGGSIGISAQALKPLIAAASKR